MKLNHKQKVNQNQKRKLYGKARKRHVPGPSGYRGGKLFDFESAGIDSGFGSFFTPMPARAARWER